YAGYVQRRHERELFVDGLYAQLEGGARDLALDPEFRRTLGASLSALRFPLHGLQMASSYLGSVAPSGEVAIACAFQAADELRRVQRLAQRMGHLRRADPALDPELDGRGRRDWEQAPQWQPLRRCVEGLLVTYDFVEAFVALQEAVKPQVDALLFQGVAMAARRAGDDVTASALGALEEDAAWHREWSAALLSVMDGAERGKGAVADLRQRWAARAAEAVAPLRGGGTAF
ncbi:MAG TPA: hypothetical protein VND93_04215, partial [Myxococcales bacterium]|nr:hypothetical protein [Myxococcales bacterium]